MLNRLEAAICTVLGTIPGMASARPYAGELADNQRATLLVPAALVTLARLVPEPDPGTGEVLARAFFSVFVCTRQAAGAELRGADAWALAAAVLARARLATWGVPGVSPAELAETAPVWSLEDRGLAVREVRFSQLVRLGEPEVLAGVTPEEVWLGIAPRIGAAHLEDYWRIDEVPDV